AWRAISPVSSVTSWLPYLKVLVIFATLEFLGCFQKQKPRRIAAPRSWYRSATQAQFLDQCLVALGILAVQVVEQAAATVDHHQQATTAVVVLLVGLEVLGELGDAGGEQGDLDFGGTGVVGAALVFFDDAGAVDGHGC